MFKNDFTFQNKIIRGYQDGNTRYGNDCPCDYTVGDSDTGVFSKGSKITTNSYQSALAALTKFDENRNEAGNNVDYSLDTDKKFEKEYRITAIYEDSQNGGGGFDSES